MNNLYLIKVGQSWHAYAANVGDRAVSRDTAKTIWSNAYHEHADSIEVVDAPQFDSDGNPFSCAWGRSYKKTDQGFAVHGKGR